MFAAVAIGIPAPLGAGHILWINLITDSLPALALGMDGNDRENLMRQPPRRTGESLFAGGGWFCMVFYGSLIAAVTLGAFFSRQELLRAQTYAFTVLGLSELFHAVGMRSLTGSAFSRSLGKNPLMLVAVLVGILMQVAVTEIPFLMKLLHTVRLHPAEWLALLLLSATPLLVHELLAFFLRKRR